ncbi:MAG: Lrp/AsnC family transcriptional regulator [Thaumarchaeota archaeon]|nr:Lrp/AsnC family transcriptional regulator [Nitrososphaerota archaeon]
MALDRIDQKIINILKDDARKPFVEIAAAVGLSEGAVRRRVSNLLRSGTIKRFTIEEGQDKGASAITLISVNPATPTSGVAERLKRLRGVDIVYEITGEYDIAAIVSAATIADANKCIDDVRKVDGVATTNTVIILRVIR